MSEERLHPDPTRGGTPGDTEPAADTVPLRLSAIVRARRAWSRRPATRPATSTPATRPEVAPPARIDPERSEAREPGDGPARSGVIRVVQPLPREVSIVELREAAPRPAAAASAEDAGGGEAPRRRLRWVGWISRRVFHG